MSNYLNKLYSKIAPERKRRFEYADKISDYLRHKLDQKNISQKNFAKKMDMSPSQLSRYMNGEANLNLETIAKLEIALGDRIIMVKEPHKLAPEDPVPVVSNSSKKAETEA